MMIAVILATLWATSALPKTWALPTWPSPADELEDLMFLHTGYRARGFAAGVTPCSFSKQGPSRIASAEWLRTAFHDMSTGNVFTGVGGLDASIMYEIGGNGGENPGPTFNNTLETFTPFFSPRASMADLIALGVHTAVRSCGGPIVKVRAGRIDATSRGPVGVPQPENSQRTFINQFARTGFNISEMIALTACGHTLGGVHAQDFPQIVKPGTVQNDFQLFDLTPEFDEKVASDFVKGVHTNPLAGALARTNTRDSDTKVFTADNNKTITALADPAAFRDTCAKMLQRMIEVVPSGVSLTVPISPYEVKPSHLQLALAGNGSTLYFSGEIRVRTTLQPASAIAKVQLLFKDRRGGTDCDSCTIGTEHKGNAAGFDDKFAFYGVSASLPVDTSISSFKVQITLASGKVEVYDNNGFEYRVQDTIMLQPKQSCFSKADSAGNLTITAAVRDTVASPNVTLALFMKIPRDCCVVPALKTKLIAMTKQRSIGPYTLFSSSYALEPFLKSSTIFDVSVTSGGKVILDSFKRTAELGSTCASFGSDGPTKPEFNYEGCFTDSVASRTLTGKASADDEMTIEKCGSQCKDYQFFGLEYGRECFCGNTKGSRSVKVEESECSMACGGDKSKVCGAQDRLNLYKNTAWIPTINLDIAGYKHLGCYDDSRDSRALSESFVYSDKMTVDMCASFCGGANYFGVEYYSECYCGATLSPRSSKQPETDCSFLCSGNSTQYCGGSDRINVYMKEPVPSGCNVDATSPTRRV
ncbi:WSC domain-containing protein 2 [Coccidioides immitis H538.4]|uniref:WSC domain-containing protein 2 n=1 Tax=Coccidioides immitis H538.4 TaxID=396776 RepID=A0A0J8S356_COCIT|nr:WSC domain-containing protein 2 [Coccidioides immitis H538.4]TPX22769.1 hypothetical protein DIZ76_014648 [Coccidioides immitis]